MDIDSADGDAWLLDALATSLLFSAAPPPPWPCGDQRSSFPMDTAAVDDAPGTRSGKPESSCMKAGDVNGRCHQLVHVSLDGDSSDVSSCFLKERLTLALRCFKESTCNQHLLVQVWAPVKNGDRYVLTTSGQPFALDQHSVRLLQYRVVSMTYVFSVDGDDVHESLGLPGRVYKQGAPEWTPNVQYYSSAEYSRLDHAINYDVHGTVALPVFDPSAAQACIAVVEVVMASKKVSYASEVDRVCKALEAVNLQSTEIVEHPHVQVCNEGRHAALAEILEILTVVSEELKLPLAQTWVPRSFNGGGVKKSCSSFINGGCMEEPCMSTSDVSFHVVDPRVWGFRDACAVHRLRRGQGVPGQAFSLRTPCFSEDVTRFSKTEYPLAHYARLFGLAGCFSVCLQSAYTGDDDYVLEFFLPPNSCRKDGEQKALLEPILLLLRRHLRTSLRVTMDEAYLRVDAVTDIADEEIKSLHVQDCSLLHKSNKRPGRRRGKAEKAIGLDVLEQYFSGTLKAAAKSLGVCPTTMKRICRQHGISRWPSRQISKVNRSISNLRKAIESVQVTSEGAFDLTSVTGPLPAPVRPSINPLEMEKAMQGNAAQLSINPPGKENRESCSQKSLENGGQESTVRMLVKDPKNQITAAADEPTAVPRIKNSGNSGIVTVKARHGEDILRFRFPSSGGVFALKDEVAKRIQMDVGVFDIRYLDDDHDWVKLTCDTDLEECMEIFRSSGGNVLRLLVTDIALILGSSCGSTG